MFFSQPTSLPPHTTRHTVCAQVMAAADSSGRFLGLEVRREWADALLAGRKTVEVRGYDLPVQFVGELERSGGVWIAGETHTRKLLLSRLLLFSRPSSPHRHTNPPAGHGRPPGCGDSGRRHRPRHPAVRGAWVGGVWGGG